MPTQRETLALIRAIGVHDDVGIPQSHNLAIKYSWRKKENED